MGLSSSTRANSKQEDCIEFVRTKFPTDGKGIRVQKGFMKFKGVLCEGEVDSGGGKKRITLVVFMHPNEPHLMDPNGKSGHWALSDSNKIRQGLLNHKRNINGLKFKFKFT